MLQQEKFWEVEGDAPLMGKNRGFLKPNTETTKQITERVSKWPSVISNDSNKTSGFDKWELKGEPERIFVKDAERTFFGPDNRQNLIKVLSFLHEKFGDYHQGLSYVTSFLLLTLDVNSTMNIVVRMNEDQKYIPGYWRAEAVAFATDAYVFDGLLLKHFPQVHTHLAKNYIFPETYAQKWFIGLCVHVLPFEALFLFFENFLTHGYKFLFQFGLSLIKHTQEQILKATTQAAIYSILRLDTKEEELSLSIVKEALNYDVSDINFVEVRKKVFDEKLKARLERAAQFKEKAKEESDDEIGSDEEDEEGEECMLCKENMPEYYCPTCKVLVCESCHKAGKAPHQKTHKVKPMDEVDMDTLAKEISSLSINKKKGKGKDSASDEEDD